MGAGVGSKSENDQKKTLSDDTNKVERLDIVQGEEIEGEEGGESANLFRHVIEEKETDRSAVDKADDKDIKEQVLPDNWDIEREDMDQDKSLEQMKEENKAE